jgi:type I restriction enzyme, S subunit
MSALVETEIGTIASEWKVATLESICEPPQYGYTASAEEEGNVRFLRITDITDSGVNWTSVPFCECPPELVGKYRLACGDIVFARIGATTGKSYLIKNPPPSVFASYLIRVRAKAEIDAGFLSYFFRSDAYWRQVNAQKNANLKKGVSGSLLKTLIVPVPSLPEQRKIAAVLGLVQRAIEQQERLIALTTELKKALLHKLFTEGLRGEPQKQTEIGPVPESWEQRALEEAGEVVYGIQAAVANNLKPVGVKILTNKNITLDGKVILHSVNYFVLKTKRHHDTVLKKGDLLFNWRSGSKEHVGKTAYFDLDGEFTHSSFILRIRPTDEVTGKYLFYYLNFLREAGYFVKSQTFSVNAKFNKSAINRLPMYLPGDDERIEIVTTLDAVTRKIEALEQKRRLLEDLFRTLLHQLMTAQVRVHEIDLTDSKQDDMAVVRYGST